MSEIKKIRYMFLMDYTAPELGWTGTLEVGPLNRFDIARVLMAYHTFLGSGVYR